MTRKQGEQFVITSDRALADAPSKHAPKRSSEIGYVWTGSAWSTTVAEAKAFHTLDEADEYTRLNYAQISGQR
jgi:hypothetical protein